MLAYVCLGLIFAVVAGMGVLLVMAEKAHARDRLVWDVERRDLLDRIQAPEQKQWQIAAEAMAQAGPSPEEIDRMVEEQFQKLPVSMVEFDSDLMD